MRHLTLKDSPTGRSKGYAFLEFPTYDRMTTCLQLFHHSMFKDGVSPSRKINVELTAGGGGAKSTQRKEKLKVKNEKLNQERKRRKKTEAEQNGAATKKKGEKANENKGDKEDAEPADDIHPSRRSRVRRA
ncbi:MAG: hypothetical protein M1838_001480 [Thelocarpon superellum]|nr:MAG: hypothetical protein M1838_001480 [Thelocarpon superellum]